MAKIDKIREKFKNDLTKLDFIELINDCDDTKTKKYVEFLFRSNKSVIEAYKDNFMYSIKDQIGILKKFDILSTNGLIENPDINQYNDISDIREAIETANISKSIGKAKKEIHIIYEDERYLLFIPLSVDAAKVYGKGTKWCVTRDEYYYKYIDKGILAYFIDKDLNRKVGLYYDMYYSNYEKITRSNTNSPKYLDLEDGMSESYYDKEMYDLYYFASKFSCWTDWDARMEFMFVPIPINIKELYIQYCKENMQTATLLNDVENKNYLNYFEGRYRESDAGTNIPLPEIID